MRRFVARYCDAYFEYPRWLVGAFARVRHYNHLPLWLPDRPRYDGSSDEDTGAPPAPAPSRDLFVSSLYLGTDEPRCWATFPNWDKAALHHATFYGMDTVEPPLSSPGRMKIRTSALLYMKASACFMSRSFAEYLNFDLDTMDSSACGAIVGLHPRPGGFHQLTETLPLSPRHLPLSPRHLPLPPRHLPLSPRDLPLSPRHLPLSLRHLPLSPRHLPFSPRHLPLSPRHLPLSPRHLPLSPRHLPLSPRHLPLSLRHLPPSPRHLPLSPRHLPLFPRHLPPVGQLTITTWLIDHCAPLPAD